MPPPHRASGQSDVCLTSVCLSRTSGLTREQRGRPRRTKIGTEVAHVTRDWDTTFKVKRSKVKVTRPLWLVVLTGQHGHTVMVARLRTWHDFRAWAGAYRGGRPPTPCYIYVWAAQLIGWVTECYSVVSIISHLLHDWALLDWARNWQMIARALSSHGLIILYRLV